MKPRIADPVDPIIIEELYDRIPDFRKAYDEDGLTVSEFDIYGATVRTLHRASTSAEPRLSFLPNAKRTGHGAHGGRLRQNEKSFADLGVYDLHRAGCDQHADGRRRSNHQSTASAVAAG